MEGKERIAREVMRVNKCSSSSLLSSQPNERVSWGKLRRLTSGKVENENGEFKSKPILSLLVWLSLMMMIMIIKIMISMMMMITNITKKLTRTKITTTPTINTPARDHSPPHQHHRNHVPYT